VLDWPFLLVVAVTVLSFRIPRLWRWRVEILTAASLVFVASVTASIGDGACLLVMAATGWVALKALARHKSHALLATGIVCVLAEFAVCRQVLPHAAGPPWLMVGRTIGLSYVMFRVIHLMVDAHGDELPDDLRLRDYLGYLFSYLTFLAGPIQRFEQFSNDIASQIRIAQTPAIATFVPAIMAGYLKFTIVAAAFYACFAWSLGPVSGVPQAALNAFASLCFAAYLYFSFSGYTDVVRGIGGMIGFDLPENFDRPFAAANFLDFWSRWHISLSDWFKLYVFNPTVKEMISRCGKPALTPYFGAVGYFIAFFLMGLWHGANARFVLYGLCLGAGVAANKLYQTEMLRRLGRPRFNALTRHRAYSVCAQGLAVSYFILILGFLWVPAINVDALGAWVEAAGLVVAGALLFIVLVRAANRPATRLASVLADSAGVICFVEAAAVLAYLILLRGFVPPLLYEYF
jgi:alginate O-acetyltransferase complex protein AlgI